MSIQAFIAMGSNIDPAENFEKALALLEKAVRIRAVSTVYRTAPIGENGAERKNESFFFNCVVMIETDLPPIDLKYRVLRKIEDRLGRVRGGDRYASRTIDLDLILYGDAVMQGGSLALPDPLIEKRPILAVPLAEVAPQRKLPGTERTVDDIASKLPRGGMEPVTAFTEGLRKLIQTRALKSRKKDCGTEEI